MKEAKTLTLKEAYLWILKNLFTPKAKKFSIGLVLLLTFGLAIYMAQALVIGEILATLKTSRSWTNRFWQLPLIYGSLWLASQIFDHWKSKLEIDLWFDTYISVNKGIFKNLTKRSPFQLKSEEKVFGLSAMARFRAAVHRVKDMLLFGAGSEFLSMVIAISFLLWFNWMVAVVMLFYVITAFFWASKANVKTVSVGRVLEKDFRKADRNRDVRLDNMSTMLHADMAERDEQKWLDLAKGIKMRHRKMWFRYEKHLLARNILGIIVAICAFVVTIYQYSMNELSFALLYPTFIWTKQVWDKTWRFANIDRVLQKIGLTIIEGVEGLLRPSITQDPEEGLIPDCTEKVTIEFRNVTFGYDVEKPIFNDLNLTLKSGSNYGLVGLTGAGKTTFLELLRGDILPQEGEVLINGISTSEIKLSWWRNFWQYCPQDPKPYPGKLREVATYLCSSEAIPSDEVLRGILLRLGLGDLFEHADGLDRDILNQGSDLSGGQKQRLMAVMATLGNPGLLILDEPTSSLDSETEERMTDLFREFSVIVVAHRLGTVAIDYQIIELGNGKASLYEDLNEAIGKSPFIKRCAGLQAV